jgi:hypothetical protein
MFNETVISMCSLCAVMYSETESDCFHCLLQVEGKGGAGSSEGSTYCPNCKQYCPVLILIYQFSVCFVFGVHCTVCACFSSVTI